MDTNILESYFPESVSGKTVAITGGTAGIGRATAVMLAMLGARVFITGRTKKHLDNTLKEAAEKNYPGTINGIVADLATKAGVASFFDGIDQEFGTLDIFINNAALSAEGIEEASFDKWKDVVDSNLLSYIACAHEAAKRMKQNEGGHIVNIGSMSAHTKEADSSVYTATKSGIRGFSESLRKELNEAGIKVTLIEPGLVGTDMTESSAKEQQKQQAELKMLKAEDIAAAIYYALIQPRRCDVVDLKIRPHLQLI